MLFALLFAIIQPYFILTLHGLLEIFREQFQKSEKIQKKSTRTNQVAVSYDFMSTQRYVHRHR